MNRDAWYRAVAAVLLSVLAPSLCLAQQPVYFPAGEAAVKVAKPAPAADDAAESASRLAIFLDGDQLRIATGELRVKVIQSFERQGFPKGSLLILCDAAEFNGGTSRTTRRLECGGHVRVRTSEFDASASRLRLTGDQLLLESDGSEPVKLIQGTAKKSEFQVTSQKIAINLAEQQITINGTTSFQPGKRSPDASDTAARPAELQ